MKTTVSIGVSFYPDNSGDAEALVRAADYAMYLAKAEGKNSWQVCPKASRVRASISGRHGRRQPPPCLFPI